MNKAELRLFRERWKAVEEIEREELRATPMETRIQQMNAIRRLAKGLGISMQPDGSEPAIYERWARLKQGKR